MFNSVKIASVVILYVMSYLSLAKDTNYKIELLNENSGFVTSNIYSILQDHQGFLWFGTAENGLMRYDGNKVTLFESQVNQTSSLSHNNAGNIYLDKSGDIWVGTWGGGVNNYDPKTNLFTHFKNDPDISTSLSSNRVQSLHQDAQGVMWFGTYGKGLNELKSGGTVFQQYIHDDDDHSTISHNRIWAIKDAAPDSLWVGTSYGLNLFDKKSNRFKVYLPNPDSDATTGHNMVRHILQSTQGQLYLGTDNGVLVFSIQDETFKQVESENDMLLGRVYSLVKDQEGVIWVGTDLGLFKLELGDNSFSKVDLPNEGAIRIVFEDRQGIIWATSETYGIYKITRTMNFFEFNNDIFNSENALIKDFDGHLIIATSEGGFYQVEKNTKVVLELTPNIFSLLPVTSIARKNADWIRKNKPVLRQPTLHQSSRSTLWFSQQSSLIKYDIETNVATEIEHEGILEVLAINSTFDGRIWVGTFKDGIYIYDPKNGEFEHILPKPEDPFSLSHPEVLVMYRDKNERLWIGTGEGLNLWDDSKNQFHVFKEHPNDETSILGNMIQSIYQTSDGAIWVGTIKGLSRLDEKTNKFQRMTLGDGQYLGSIKSISEDDNGNLWLTTKKGVTKLNPVTNEVWNYNQDYGLIGKKYYTEELVKTNDGLIYVNGPRGIHYFNSLEIKSLKSNAQVVLTEFQKIGVKAVLDEPYSYVEDISISHNENFFTFEFSSLDLLTPDQNQYAYMLEGFDKDWLYIGNKNTASYTNLDGGEYVFRVKTSRGDDEWSDKELAIKIIITPPIWKTWWAYCLYFLMSGLVLFGYVRYTNHVKNLEIQKQKLFVETLEQQVSEKTASLREKTAALEASNIELEQLTYTDALSALYNRRYFDIYLKNEIERHKRQQEALTLIICDIDFFKLYNDKYGHIVGDQCIQQVANCMGNIVNRSTDSICRYGGEEFALILPFTDVDKAIQVVKNITQALAALNIKHESSPNDDLVTMSYGIHSIIPELNTFSEHMIEAADKALYESKGAGRNCYTVFDAKPEFVRGESI